jgi:hypothetical protein
MAFFRSGQGSCARNVPDAAGVVGEANITTANIRHFGDARRGKSFICSLALEFFTRFRGASFQPLTHLSGCKALRLSVVV